MLDQPTSSPMMTMMLGFLSAASTGVRQLPASATANVKDLRMFILVSPIVSFEFSVRADWVQRNRLGKSAQAVPLEIKRQRRLQARLLAVIGRPSAVIDAD